MRAIRRPAALCVCVVAMGALAGCTFDGSVVSTGGTSGSSSGGTTGTPVFVNAYYLSPGGSDQGAGTQAAPWKTFAHALPALGPGDGLFLLDGTYDGSSSGYLDIDCSSGANNGLPGKPVTVLALNERKAFLRADGSTDAPIMISNCSDWAIQGLHAEYGDIPLSDPNYGGSVVQVASSNDIAVRRMLIAHPDINGQGNIAFGIRVSSSTNVVVEDNELYDFPYDGIDAYFSSGLIIRRNYLNARGEGSPDGGATAGDGIVFGATGVSIAEDNVVEGTNRGYFVIAGDGTQLGATDDDLLAGDVALHCYEGFQIDAYCGGGNAACAGQEPHRTRLVDDVAYRSDDFGFGLFNTGGSTMQSVSALGNFNDGVRFIEADPNVNATLIGQNDLAASNGWQGFFTDGTYGWRLEAVDSAQNSVDYAAPDAGPDAGFVNAQSQPTGMGSCVVYVPASSWLSTAGVGGAPIGANLVFRYVDGGLTAQKLWDPTTGQFPCGAIVAGVNDLDGGSCIDVNRRLNVGANGCGIP